MSSGIDNSPRVDPDEIIAGIRKWVEIETPSPAGTAVNMLVDEVAVHGAQLGGHVNRRAGRDGYGDLLTVRSPWGGDGPGILVLSHLDTVHPIATFGPWRSSNDAADYIHVCARRRDW